MTDRRCVGGCCDNRPGWEWIEDPVTHVREKRRQEPQPGQHGTDGHECVPRMAEPGSYLCGGDERLLGSLVEAMPGYATDLARSITHSGERQRVQRADESPDFHGPRKRTEALNQLGHDVTWWVREVSEERGLATPALDSVRLPVVTVWRGCRWLRRHTGWLAARPSADEALDGWKQMQRDAAVAMDLPRDRSRFEVGPCPEDCEGVVWAFIGTQASDSAMGCDVSTEHHWNPAQFYRAGMRIKRKMGGSS